MMNGFVGRYLFLIFLLVILTILSHLKVLQDLNCMTFSNMDAHLGLLLNISLIHKLRF